MPAPVGIVPSTNASPPRDSKGWDGKLRVDKKATITNPEALSDPDYSDEDAPPRAQIEADEGLLQIEGLLNVLADAVVWKTC